jgi:hypothetical protein
MSSGEPWLPFFLIGVIAFSAATLMLLYYDVNRSWQDTVQAISALCAVAVALSIPLVLDHNSTQTRTLELVNDVNRSINSLNEQISSCNIVNGKRDAARFDPDYIISNLRLRDLTIRMLNEYEFLCAGMNSGLLDAQIVMSLRHEAIDETFGNYINFFDAWHRMRATQNKEAPDLAWTQCRTWRKENRWQKMSEPLLPRRLPEEPASDYHYNRCSGTVFTGVASPIPDR